MSTTSSSSTHTFCIITHFLADGRLKNRNSLWSMNTQFWKLIGEYKNTRIRKYNNIYNIVCVCLCMVILVEEEASFSLKLINASLKTKQQWKCQIWSLSRENPSGLFVCLFVSSLCSIVFESSVFCSHCLHLRTHSTHFRKVTFKSNKIIVILSNFQNASGMKARLCCSSARVHRNVEASRALAMLLLLMGNFQTCSAKSKEKQQQ